MRSGTDRHTALAELLQGKDSVLSLLNAVDREGVEWAADYIKLHAPMEEHPLIIEQKVEIKRGDTLVMDGTPDVRCGDHLFDLKWRDANYAEQMAAYALGMMQAGRPGPITVHILYAERRFVEELQLSRADAESIVFGIVDGKQVPTPCEYCDWCDSAPTCPALTCRAVEVAQKALEMEVLPVNWLILSDPNTAAQALNLAEAVTTWADAVKTRVKELMCEGTMVPGWTVKERSGARAIKDLQAAQHTLGMTSKDFLDCCTVSIGKLETKYSQLYGHKPSEGKKIAAELLSPLTEKKNNTITIERIS